MYFDIFREDRYYKKVKSCFEKKCEPNEVHDLIMLLRPRHILTTNYDTLIEETAVKHGRNFSVINSDKKVSKTTTLDYIVKMHGDFESDKCEFVLKEKIIDENIWRKSVCEIFYAINDYCEVTLCVLKELKGI